MRVRFRPRWIACVVAKTKENNGRRSTTRSWITTIKTIKAITTRSPRRNGGPIARDFRSRTFLEESVLSSVGRRISWKKNCRHGRIVGRTRVERSSGKDGETRRLPPTAVPRYDVYEPTIGTLATIRALLFSLLVSATFSFLAVKKVGRTKDAQGSLRLFPNSVLASFDAVALD